MNKTYLCIAIATALIIALVYLTPAQKAGDIAEYYGMIESLVNHGGITLQLPDQKNLERVLHPSYFVDPQYYVAGRNGARWPVHFFFYSLIALPVRLMLQLFGANELYTLALTNILILTVTALFVVNNFCRDRRSFVFLLLFYLSPLLFFITWPGPDLFYSCLLLISIFYFFEKNYFAAAILAVIASWQSQPLVLIAGFMTLFYVEIAFRRRGKNLLSSLFFLIVLISLPYLYNLYAFGILTPWTRFENGWTFINGFGMQNIRIGKLYEQFFDPNIGLFWYAPLLGLLGIFALLSSITEFNNLMERSEGLSGAVQKRLRWIPHFIRNDRFFLLFIFFLTAFFYQTNPAWHYGTAGYGPTRHILFFVPLLIVICLQFLMSKTWTRSLDSSGDSLGMTPLLPTQSGFEGHGRMGWVGITLIGLFILIQLFVLSLNGLVTPNFENTLHNSPFATFILNTIPQFYNPTPELFVDRTNHTDLDHPTSAVYKHNGICKKAYVLQTDGQFLMNECSTIPEKYKGTLDNEFLRKANYKRVIKATEATLWPDAKSCDRTYEVKNQSPYMCLETIDDVMKETGITDKTRITTLAEFPALGIWKIKQGKAVVLTIPPGYIVNHSALVGTYVNY